MLVVFARESVVPRSPRTSSSCNFLVHQLHPDTIDHHDRFGRSCATGKCPNVPTHVTYWDYVTGRGGNLATAARQVCSTHAGKFAAKHDLTIEGVRPVPTSMMDRIVAGITGADQPDRTVRVVNHYGRSWYLEMRSSGRGGFGVSNRWLCGVPGTATLEEAINEAELVLAQSLAVPAGQWQHAGGWAATTTTAAWKSPAWIDEAWQLHVSCDDKGMWQLTRVLDNRFPPLNTSLGNHNMNLQRALAVADRTLAEQRWRTVGKSWSIHSETAVAHQLGFHPDQTTHHHPQSPQPQEQP